MSSLTTSLQGVASRLLAEHGEPITLRRTTAGAYDPATGTTSTTGTQDVAVQGFVSAGFGGTASALLRSGLLEGVIVRPGDRLVLVAATDLPSGFVPVPGDSAIVATNEYRVITTTPSPAGAEVVVWRLQLRPGGE